MRRFLHWPTICLIGVLAVLPWMSRFSLYLFYMFAIASISSLALNLMIGYAGQISFAQGALIGVGAYTCGLLSNAGFDVGALVAAGVVTAGFSVLIGFPSLRLHGLYFAMATLAAQFILEYLFKNLDPITRGMSGLMIGTPHFFGIRIESDLSYAVSSVVLLYLAWVVCTNIVHSDLGRGFMVVRDSEVVARGMGLDPPRLKFWCFLVSGFFTGVAGGMLGIVLRFAHPETFGLNMSIDYVAMIIMGGLGSLGGSLIGAVFVTLIPEAIQRLGEGLPLADRLFALREITFGMLVILFLIFEPRGLMSIIHSAMRPFTNRFVQAKRVEPASPVSGEEKKFQIDEGS